MLHVLFSKIIISKIINGVLFSLAFTCLIINPQICLSLVKVGKYKVHELRFTAQTSQKNPFDTYLLKVEVTDPNKNKIVIDGYFDGDGSGGQEGKIWKARICPYMTGNWSWRTVTGDAHDIGLADLKGQFICDESGDPGGLVVDGKHFRFQDGGFTYLQGNFLDFTNGLLSTHTFMSEKITDTQRGDIMARHLQFHTANKVNVYFANKGDYGGQSVTPWVGSALSNDKMRMDLARWKKYDGYIRSFKDNGMLAEMWFFADDSGFGSLTQKIRNRLFRYAMARTSAFSNALYVIALEWGEGWSKSSVMASGNFIQAHNPWRRLLSVHNITPNPWAQLLLIPKHMHWAFSGQSWATFIATQPGNSSNAKDVNQLAIKIRDKEDIPHISEEFGILNGDSDTRLRTNMWVNFCGGAAGGGTGSDLKAFMRFLEQSRVPFERMHAANKLVSGGGEQRFCLAEEGHHYIVCSQSGAFNLKVNGRNLKGCWFNPRDPKASLGFPFIVSPGKRFYVPPDNISKDWVLWISDSSNLNSGNLYPCKGSVITTEIINRP